MKTTTLSLRKALQSYGTILALVCILMVFSLIRPASFCTLTNFINISRQISLLVMISLGTTLVMSVNEFDLSVGSIASLGGIIAALLAVKGLPMVVLSVSSLGLSMAGSWPASGCFLSSPLWV